MYYDLNKRDKKIARLAIDKGLDEQFRIALEEARQSIDSWQTENLNNSDAYHQLYKIIDKHNSEIGRRYDGLTGSRYLVTVAAVLFEGLITDDDIKDFSDEAKEMVARWIGLWKNK